MYTVELYQRIRRACHVEGMSVREAARVFGVHRGTVRKMLRFSIPPGYQKQGERVRPKLGPYTGMIERILEEDKTRPVKQRHTALRIYQRLRDEHGFTGGYPSQRATDSGAGSEDGSGTLFSLPVHERSGGNQPLDLREAIGGTWPPDRRSIFERGGVP